jgi:hypothetical protein
MPESQEGTQKLEEQPLKKHEETWYEEKPSEKESDVDKHQKLLRAHKEQDEINKQKE